MTISKIMTTALFSALFITTTLAQNLADLFNQVSESVVVIGTVQNRQLGGGIENKVSEAGLGSGVLVSDDGLIWTAAHVVQLAEVVKVKFKNGDIYEARVLTSDPTTDLAMIKIEQPIGTRRIATIGDSDGSRIGDDIFVIGAPRGLEYSLSRGIISGRMKQASSIFGASHIELLQVDAAINPGNSGGPIFNMNGEVIGIASFILSESGGFEGIGFAASSNIASEVLMRENLIWSGFEGVTVTGPIAQALNIPGEGGFLIVSVASAGLGAELGLQGGTVRADIEGTELLIGGDVILDVAGIPCHDQEGSLQIRSTLAKLPKGSNVELTILRAGRTMKKSFAL